MPFKLQMQLAKRALIHLEIKSLEKQIEGTTTNNNINDMLCPSYVFVMTSRPYPLYVHHTIKVDSILFQKFAL